MLRSLLSHPTARGTVYLLHHAKQASLDFWAGGGSTGLAQHEGPGNFDSATGPRACATKEAGKGLGFASSEGSSIGDSGASRDLSTFLDKEGNCPSLSILSPIVPAEGCFSTGAGALAGAVVTFAPCTPCDS
mmetsp:Transcript_116545/g.206087  ORF Transcript_116545/g.206087 Transcript_116545/m.206087 type:complete len:132 (+) Transcript_116545:217-612(+)